MSTVLPQRRRDGHFGCNDEVMCFIPHTLCPGERPILVQERFLKGRVRSTGMYVEVLFDTKVTNGPRGNLRRYFWTLPFIMSESELQILSVDPVFRAQWTEYYILHEGPDALIIEFLAALDAATKEQ